MSLDGALEPDAQLAEGGQPSVCSFDHPAVAPQPVIAFDTPPCDAALDASSPEVPATACKVVALVGMQESPTGSFETPLGIGSSGR